MDPKLFSRMKEISNILEVREEGVPLSDERRALFEEFLSVYKTYPPYWIQYIEEELNSRQYENAERLFYRCLPNVPSVELFLLYINYVIQYKHENRITDIREIQDVYNYALQNVGMDMNSYPLYQQYAKFVCDHLQKDLQDGDAFEMKDIRFIYDQAMSVPMDGLKELQNDYLKWELELARNLYQTREKEIKKRFGSTAPVYHIKKKYHKQLDYALYNEGSQLFDSIVKWHLFIEFEKSNQLNSPPHEYKTFVTYAYRLTLTRLRYVWFFWHEYGQFLQSIGDSEEALEVYGEACEILPTNMVLAFAKAEIHEKLENIPQVEETYQHLFSVLKSQIENGAENAKENFTLAAIQYLKFHQRIEGPISMRQYFVRALSTGFCSYHLCLAITEIESQRIKDKDAALRILHYSYEKFKDDPNFITEIIDIYVKIDAPKQLIELLEDSNSLEKILPPENAPKKEKDAILPLLWKLHNYLLYTCEPQENQLMQNITDALKFIDDQIIKYDPKENQKTMEIRRLFLSPNDINII